MNTQELLRLLQNSEVRAHADALLKHARPTALLVREEVEVQLAKSRLNNAPDLPPDFEWPQQELGPYRFLAQFNLGDLPGGMPPAPTQGLLSLFYQYDQDGGCFWGDPGFVIARYFPTDQELVRTEQPESVDIGDPIPLKFIGGVDLPEFSAFIDKPKVIDWPLGIDLAKTYEEIRRSWHDQNDYLFGYPTNHTLGYDPTPDAGWRSLLTLETDEDLQWYWHDGDTLVTFIQTAKLATGDFSEIRADAG